MASISQTSAQKVWENKLLKDMKYVDFIFTFIALIMRGYTTMYTVLSIEDESYVFVYYMIQSFVSQK